MLSDIVKIIWDVFGDERLTTKEVEFRLLSLFNYKCPDDFAKSLMMMKQGNLVRGEVSVDKGGWVWWVDDECRKADLSKILW